MATEKLENIGSQLFFEYYWVCFIYTFCCIQRYILVVIYLSKQFSNAWTFSLTFCAEDEIVRSRGESTFTGI